MNNYDLYIQSIQQYQPLSVEEEERLGHIILSKTLSKQEKDEAKHKMINHNLLCVVKIAAEYKEKPSWRKLDIMDIISAGNIGLTLAVNKYKVTAGRFMTYADSWIRRNIHNMRAAETNLIHKPEPLVRAAMVIGRVHNSLENILGREPSSAEIVEALDGVKELPKVEELIMHNINNIVSMDNANAMSDDEDLNFIDIIPSKAKTPEEVAFEDEKVETLRQALSELPEVHRRVLELSFGLFGQEGKTFEEIAEILQEENLSNQGKKYSKQNISLIRIRAIDLIRSNPKSMKAIAECLGRG